MKHLSEMYKWGGNYMDWSIDMPSHVRALQMDMHKILRHFHEDAAIVTEITGFNLSSFKDMLNYSYCQFRRPDSKLWEAEL
jgi:hypothetical protein